MPRAHPVPLVLLAIATLPLAGCVDGLDLGPLAGQDAEDRSRIQGVALTLKYGFADGEQAELRWTPLGLPRDVTHHEVHYGNTSVPDPANATGEAAYPFTEPGAVEALTLYEATLPKLAERMYARVHLVAEGDEHWSNELRILFCCD